MSRRAVLTVGLGAATLCAFGVSASATIDMARGAGMQGLVQPMLVGVLELLSLGCAWGWVTTEDSKLKREFASVMGVASAVSAVAGFLAFGLVGLVAPAALIAAVHVTSRMWVIPQDKPEVADPLPQEATIPPAVPALAEPVDAGQDEDSIEDTCPVPVLSSVPTGRDVEDVVSALLSRDKLPGIGAIAGEFGIGKGKATQCKSEALRRREEEKAG